MHVVEFIGSAIAAVGKIDETLPDRFILTALLCVIAGAAVILLLPASTWSAIERIGLLLAPGAVWRLIDRLARHHDEIDAPFDCDGGAEDLVEAEGLSMAFCELEAGEAAIGGHEVHVGGEAALEDDSQAARLSMADLVHRRCKMDLASTLEGLELTVEIPGLDEKDVEVSVSHDTLTVSGQFQLDRCRPEQTWRIVERDYGLFSRSIDLPGGVPTDRITAALNRGLLTIKIPNPAQPERKNIYVQAHPLYLTETADSLQLAFDASGFEEDDIEVSVIDDVLTMRGNPEATANIMDRAGPLAMRARNPFSRSIKLPTNADADKIVAELSNGVLRVAVPKLAPPAPKRIQVYGACGTRGDARQDDGKAKYTLANGA